MQEASMIDSREQVHDTENVVARGRWLTTLVSMSKQGVDFTSNDHFHDALWA
jgi:hypothetical protein